MDNYVGLSVVIKGKPFSVREEINQNILYYEVIVKIQRLISNLIKLMSDRDMFGEEIKAGRIKQC